jgi:hypothetical protein
MRIFLIASLLLGSSAASACFLSGEDTSGMNKICYYDCVSGKRAITIRATSLCPLSLSQIAPSTFFAKRPSQPQTHLLLAHSGGTDSEGCHTNHKTGYRHCH